MFARPEAARSRPGRSDRPDPRPWLVLFGLAALLRVLVVLARASGPALQSAGPLASWIAGLIHRMTPHPTVAAIAFAVIGAFAPLAAAALGASMFGGQVGRWAAIACAVDPILVWADPAAATAASTTALAALATAAWVRTPRP